MTLRGTKPRPRTVLLGQWEPEPLAELRRLFPTVYEFPTEREYIQSLVPEEVDVIVCGANAGVRPRRAAAAHTIVFGPNGGGELPSIHFPAAALAASLLCQSEEHQIMDVPSVLLPPLTRWLKTFEDPRGRRVIFECPVGNPRFATKRDLSDVAVVMARQPNGPLAVQYFQESSKRGLAWFPSGVPNEVDWVRALLALWADGDPEGLPGFRDWHIHPDWMANEELDVTRELSVLLQERNSAMERFAAREAEIKARLLAATQAATIGARRVLTCQGDDLVMAVSQMLESLGFAVKDVDATKTSGVPKREDLRLTLAARDSWEAIVEVKGYTKSAGKMADLHQLERHASHYAVEKGRRPDLLIYIVNGEIETTVSPELRRRSFHEEDLHVFATDGVVLPTPDLFRLHRDRLKLGIGHVQRLLLDARGLFTYPAKDK